MPAHRTGQVFSCARCGDDVYRAGYWIKVSTQGRYYCSTACRNARDPIIVNDDGTAAVPLYQGGEVRAYALIDAADAEWVGQWRWALRPDGYAVRSERLDGHAAQIRLHRALLGLDTGDEREGDHINRNRLDNRRGNLRALPKGQNSQNVPGFGGTSQHRGVYFNKATQKWVAYINVPGDKMHHLGQFTDESEAAGVARSARLRLMPAAVD